MARFCATNMCGRVMKTTVGKEDEANFIGGIVCDFITPLVQGKKKKKYGGLLFMINSSLSTRHEARGTS